MVPIHLAAILSSLGDGAECRIRLRNIQLHPRASSQNQDGAQTEPRWLTWMSLWGFQSESKMTTVSAVARLIPRPPARVDSRKQNWHAPGADG